MFSRIALAQMSTLGSLLELSHCQTISRVLVGRQHKSDALPSNTQAMASPPA